MLYVNRVPFPSKCTTDPVRRQYPITDADAPKDQAKIHVITSRKAHRRVPHLHNLSPAMRVLQVLASPASGSLYG